MVFIQNYTINPQHLYGKNIVIKTILINNKKVANLNLLCYTNEMELPATSRSEAKYERTIITAARIERKPTENRIII